MSMIESTTSLKKTKNESRFANLPYDLQVKIRRYLEVGDFRSAKALYDANLDERKDKH
jgi:hypothetical protein